MRRRTDPAEPGIALVAVLWLLLLLSVIAASLLHEVREERALATTTVLSLQGQLASDAGINQAILRLAARVGAIHWQLDGTAQEVQLFGTPVVVSVESEAGKIDLNNAPRDLLSALFAGSGLAPGDAEALADRVIEWRSPGPNFDPDPTAAPYAAAGVAYRPRHGLFRTIGELRLVAGMTDELQVKLAPLITVYSRVSAVDWQVASAEVLGVLGAAGDTVATRQQDAKAAGNAAGANRSLNVGEAVTIRARCELGGLVTIRTAVIRFTGDARQPYWVLDWN